MTTRQTYKTNRTRGGLKGLGTGAKSSFKRTKPMAIIRQPRVRRTQQEIKTVDHTFEAAYVTPYVPDILAKTRLNCSSTGTLQALMVQQGVGTNQRVGNALNLKSMRLRFRISPTTNNVAAFSQMRLMVIYDTQPNGAYPTTANIIANINEAGTVSTFDIFGDVNPNNMTRFIVLMDEFKILPPIDNTLNGAWVIDSPSTSEDFKIDRFINLRGIEQKYQATSSPMVIANQTAGALYLLSMGDVPIGTEPYCWYGRVRLRFYDK